MDRNIFYKKINETDKYNPDVLASYTNAKNELKKSYTPVTVSLPPVPHDNSYDNIAKAAKAKENERSKQDFLFQTEKNNKGLRLPVMNLTSNNMTYEQMKKESESFHSSMSKDLASNYVKYKNIVNKIKQ
jgi:hypothetical protein